MGVWCSQQWCKQQQHIIDDVVEAARTYQQCVLTSSSPGMAHRMSHVVGEGQVGAGRAGVDTGELLQTVDQPLSTCFLGHGCFAC